MYNKIVNVHNKFSATNPVFATKLLKTTLGAMTAVADDNAVYLLEFADDSKLERKLARLTEKTGAILVPGRMPIIDLLEQELDRYFAGQLQQFTVPVVMLGTPFQLSVWQALQQIPFGQTCSYAQLAQAVGKPTAWRAVAQANGANNLPLIIPCHRVINTGGNLGGYSSGLERKIWLLEHESKGQCR